VALVPVYVYANTKLRYGKTQLFHETMSELRPVFADLGWHLVAGYGTRVGDLQQVHDIWEVADADTVVSALARVHEDPRWPPLERQLAECIEHDSIAIVDKTPYSD
jgi:hypothetical protein